MLGEQNMLVEGNVLGLHQDIGHNNASPLAGKMLYPAVLFKAMTWLLAGVR